jgi:hypothetical protein
MRIVNVIRDCFDSMTVLKSFINEPRGAANQLTDNTELPFLILNRPIEMPYEYLANNVQEVYDILLIYGHKNANTDLGQSQDSNDVEIEIMRQQAKIMILNLDRHVDVREVRVTQPVKDYIDGFDVNAAGVFQYLRITLLPPSPDVCATLPVP